jgi:hypothetical protein
MPPFGVCLCGFFLGNLTLDGLNSNVFIASCVHILLRQTSDIFALCSLGSAREHRRRKLLAQFVAIKHLQDRKLRVSSIIHKLALV